MPDREYPRPVLPGEDTKTVSLREFEQRNSELRTQFTSDLAHERELRETITRKLEEARQLNAVEIFRRLDELNHAHQTAMENWARSLPRELFDGWQKEYDKWQGEVNTTLTIIAPHAEILAGLNAKVLALDTLITSLGPISAHLHAVDARVAVMERLNNKLTGAGILLGLMGLSGVLALILGLARLARGQ